MKTNRLILFALLLVAGLSLNGCAHVATYHADYLPSSNLTAPVQIEGKALIYTDSADDAYVYSGSPTSITGGGTTLTIELGKMTREIAVVVFGGLCKDGYDTANAISTDGKYAVVIKPKLASFSYEYNSLKNLGFAITPQVVLQLNMRIYNKERNVVFEKNYDSGVFDGETYILTLNPPGEKINAAAHNALYNMMMLAAEDVRREFTHVKTSSVN